MPMPRLAILGLAILALMTHESLAADIQVYSSGAPAQVAQRLASKFFDTSGHRVVLTSATIAEMQRKLAAGDTPDAVRKLLVDARSIVQPDPVGGGFAGAQIAAMIARLGIADVVTPKASYKFAIGGGTAAVAKGDAEIGLFNISEILIDKGVTLVGPLPPSLQSYIVFAGAVHVESAAPDAARAFLRSLAAPEAREAWTSGGLEPLGR